MTLYDAVGLVGVAAIAAAYLLLQTDRLAPRAPAYSALNAVGAALILVSLIRDFNLSAFLIEAFWLLVSLYGLYRSRRADPTSADPRP